MPYLLETSSSNARVDPATDVIIGGNIGDYVEFSGYANAGNDSGNYRIIGFSSDYDNIIELSPSRIFFRAKSNSAKRAQIVFDTGYVQPAIGDDFIVRLEKINSTDFEIFLDGVSVGVGSADGQNFTSDQFLNFDSSSEAFQGGCYYIEACTDGTGVATNRWLNTTGTGTVWIDQIGTNDATQVGTWPADNSEWVFYSTGPNTPINPSITNLLATSARLNWEQG